MFLNSSFGTGGTQMVTSGMRVSLFPLVNLDQWCQWLMGITEEKLPAYRYHRSLFICSVS